MLIDTPKILIVAEILLGLAPLIVEQIYASLRQLLDAGTALHIIEQYVADALRLCDRVVLLDYGTVSWVGTSVEAGDRIQSRFGV